MTIRPVLWGSDMTAVSYRTKEQYTFVPSVIYLLKWQYHILPLFVWVTCSPLAEIKTTLCFTESIILCYNGLRLPQ